MATIQTIIVWIRWEKIPTTGDFVEARRWERIEKFEKQFESENDSKSDYVIDRQMIGKPWILKGEIAKPLEKSLTLCLDYLFDFESSVCVCVNVHPVLFGE